MGKDNDKGKTALAVIGGAAGITALIVALTKKAKAAPPPEEGVPPIITTVTLAEEERQALAAILSQQVDIADKIKTANQTLTNIAELLGAEVPRRILEPFEKENQTLQRGIPFNIYESTPGEGALIWAIFDVSSPLATLTFRFDDLVWDFNINTLITQGIDQPLFPGVWLAKAADKSSFITGQKDVTTAGTPVQLDNVSIPYGFPVPIIAKPGNTGLIYFGNSAADCADAAKRFDGISAGLAVSKHVVNLNEVWIDASVSGEGVSWYTPTAHYCLVFSAGNLNGFGYKMRLIISLTYEGDGTATLYQARGIKWTKI